MPLASLFSSVWFWLAVLVLALLWVASCAPMINDITTTTSAPPAFQALAESESGYPQANIAVQEKHYPALAPLQLSEPADTVFSRVVELARSMDNWTVVAEDAEQKRLEAIAETSLFGFKDDVVIEVRAESSGSSVHMRSRSRIGKSDLGTNAKRIESFLAALRQAMTEQMK